MCGKSWKEQGQLWSEMGPTEDKTNSDWQVAGACEVQADAASRVEESGPQHVPRAVRLLARLGSQGKHPGNCERDLLRLVARECPLPIDPFLVDVELNSPDGLELVESQVPLLLPHELFSALFSQGQAQWARSIASGSCRYFWEELRRGTPTFAQHPAYAEVGAQLSHTVPLRIHGDGAQFSQTESMIAMTWASCVAASGSPFHNRFLMLAVPKALLRVGSLDQILQPIAWSLAVLLDGTHPHTDFRGRPWPDGSKRQRLAGTRLAGPWCAGIVDVVGDWQWICELLHVPYWSADAMCWECCATQAGHLQFCDFRREAPWRNTTRTSQDLFALQPAHRQCPLLLIPGFSIDCVRWDTMHTVNLGVALWVVAGVLLHCARQEVFGQGTLADRLKVAWGAFKRWSQGKRVHCQIKRFTPSSLSVAKGGAFAEFRGKAYGTRVVVAWLAELTQGNVQADIETLCWSLATIFSCMEHAGRFFSCLEQERFCCAGDAVLFSYARLAEDALRHGRLEYPVRPKCHGFAHIVSWVKNTGRNPKYSACFLDEDMLGKTVSGASRCHRATVAFTVLQRYQVRLVRLWRGLDKKRRHLKRWRPRPRLHPPPQRP